MPAPKEKKTKEAIAKAASSGAKGKKKKWSKGKTKEKLNNLVLYTKEGYEKMLKEVPQYKLITTSVISDRHRANGSLARSTILELESKGLIKAVSRHRSQCIYTRVAAN